MMRCSPHFDISVNLGLGFWLCAHAVVCATSHCIKTPKEQVSLLQGRQNSIYLAAPLDVALETLASSARSAFLVSNLQRQSLMELCERG